MYRQAAITILQQRHSVVKWSPQTSSARWFATKRQKRVAAQKQKEAAAAAATSRRGTGEPSSPSLTTNEEPSSFLVTPKTPSTFIKTDLTDHVDWRSVQYPRLDPSNPPPLADESGVVERDLTEEMMDLTDIYDPRLHLNPDFDDTYESSTPLSTEMMQLLAVTNRPMTCADFMRQALTHPSYGYYTNPTQDNDWEDDWDDDDSDWDKDDSPTTSGPDSIIGPRGDFVTAPEVSQVFGECLAVWMVTQWESMGKPGSTRFIEVGPGKGTLLADIVRASLESFEYFGNSIQEIRLVEASPAMRAEQEKRLKEIDSANWVFQRERSNFGKNDEAEATDADDDDEEEESSSHVAQDDDKPTITVTWHDAFLDVVAATANKEMPSFVICQEFLDALPVHVFEKTSEGWRERLIDVNIGNDENSKYQPARENVTLEQHKKPRLRFVVAPDTSPALRTLLNLNQDDYKEGQVVEVCPDAILLAQDIAKLLERQGGASLIIDYGQEGTGDTLRGFSHHKQVHVLSRPGMVDVTADVDFSALKHAVNYFSGEEENCNNTVQAFGPVPQGQFLGAMGIVERVSQLIDDERTTEKQANDLYMALERLCLPEQMGERYKVMAICKTKHPPAGF